MRTSRHGVACGLSECGSGIHYIMCLVFPLFRSLSQGVPTDEVGPTNYVIWIIVRFSVTCYCRLIITDYVLE